MDPKLLLGIGLTEGETKVYLALLKLGQTKTGLLAKEAQVSSSKVYKILDRLMKKGLAGNVTKGKVKYYSAMEPERILDYISEKEKKLEQEREQVQKIIPELNMAQMLSGKENAAVVYEGFKAVTNFFRNILNDLKKGDKYYVIGATYGDVPGLRPFFHQYHQERSKRKIKVKMLANFETKGNLEDTTSKTANIRYLPQQFISNMQITFYKNKAFIALWTNEPIGFLIKNEEAVKSFRSYFDTLWKVGKK